MQPHIHIKSHQAKLATPTQGYISIASGKSHNTYLNAALVNLIVRQLQNNKPLQNKSTNTTRLACPPLLSPYTRVYGRREAPDKIHSNPNKKHKPTRTHIKDTLSDSLKNTLPKQALTNQKHIQMRIHKRRNKHKDPTKKSLATNSITISKHKHTNFKTYIYTNKSICIKHAYLHSKMKKKTKANLSYTKQKKWTQNKNKSSPKCYFNQHNNTQNTNTKSLTPTFGTLYRLKMTGQGSKGASRDLTTDPDFIMRDAISPPQGVKRGGGNKTTSAQKKTKSAPKEGPPPTKQFWLGFEMMEKLAIEEGTPIHATPTTLHSLIRNGFSNKEAREFLKATSAYPHVSQSCFPVSRPDGITEQHFNITQLPFEVETDPDTGLSLDYQVAVYFQRPNRPYSHEEILAATHARLKDMRIALGNKIAEPIAILCRNGSTRYWASTIKLHLKHPGVDGINLLNGSRPFILTLEEVMTIGKVCKSYNTIAKNNLLSVKISSPYSGT